MHLLVLRKLLNCMARSHSGGKTVVTLCIGGEEDSENSCPSLLPEVSYILNARQIQTRVSLPIGLCMG